MIKTVEITITGYGVNVNDKETRYDYPYSLNDEDYYVLLKDFCGDKYELLEQEPNQYMIFIKNDNLDDYIKLIESLEYNCISIIYSGVLLGNKHVTTGFK